MRILQQYILFELIRVFTSILSLLTVLLLLIGMFKEVNDSGISVGKAMEIMPYIVPSMLPFTIPATLLLTVCVVYGRIAGDLEIIAAKAAGINVMTIISPALLLAVFLSIGSLVLTDRMIPWAVVNIKQAIAESMEDIFLDMLRANQHMQNDQLGFTINVMDVKDRTLIMPTFKYHPINQQTEITLQAQKSTLEFDMENQVVILHLEHGYIDIPGKQRIWFEKEDKVLPLPTQKTIPAPRHITIKRLSKQMNQMMAGREDYQNEKDCQSVMSFVTGDFSLLPSQQQVGILPPHEEPNRYNKLNTEIHNRYAMACSCFFFVLLGCPVAILQAKKQFLTTFMLCFVPIMVLYYPLTLGLINLSKTGTINPVWAMWIGNGMLFISACVVLRKVTKY